MKCCLINMIHENPGEPPIATPTRDPGYLAKLGFDGDIVMDALAGCSLANYDPKLVSDKQTHDHKHMMEHRGRISNRIAAIAESGLEPYLYTDVPVIPRRALELYPTQLTHENSQTRLCLSSPKLWALISCQLEEAFVLYPQAKGIFVRFGENYARYNTPHMVGNDIIMKPCDRCDRLSKVERYQRAIKHLCDRVCDKLDKELIVRTWSGGYDGMHMDPCTYRSVTKSFKPNDKLWFSTKLTRTDFWRYELRNPNLGSVDHNQIIEIQLAREYEGKGAFPNWLAGGWLFEWPEMARVKNNFLSHGGSLPHPEGEKRLPIGNGALKGIFAWTRGGGWGGPYLKYHDWIDVNSFAMGRLASDPNQFDPQYAAALWCEQEYGWNINSQETRTFYSILQDSQIAVLKMLYSFDYASRNNSSWMCASGIWFRDDHLINELSAIDNIIKWAIENGCHGNLLLEKKQAVDVWSQMKDKIYQIQTRFSDKARGQALVESIEAVGALARAIEALWTVRLRWYEAGCPAKHTHNELTTLWDRFRTCWKLYQDYEGKGVATPIRTGWRYADLADAFEDQDEHFASSDIPIYRDKEGGYHCG